MIFNSNNLNITGTTYSTVVPNIYDIYKEKKDPELFEKVVQDLILHKYADDDFKEVIELIDKSDVRLAIMSLIDKETTGDMNISWSEMKAYVDSGLSKMDHVKDVIKIINKFVKDGKTEKKKFGEVMTDISLVREMLDTLPKDVWSNPNLKWLDPANGCGTFPFVVIYKLMKGLEKWEKDDEKRYRHIVENMIYTCELQSRNVFLWLCGIDPHDEYKVNAYWGSFLDDEFDYHMKNVWGLDGFDLVIGNPPYNDGDKTEEANKLYPHFIFKSLNILKNDGYLNMITPTGWFNNTADIGKGKTGISILDLFKKFNLLKLNPNSDYIKKKYFNDVGSTFCYFLVQKNSSYKKTFIASIDNNNIDIDIKSLQSLPKINNALSYSIIIKFNSKIENEYFNKINWVDQNHNLLNEESKEKTDLLKYISYHTPAKNITYVYSSNEHPNQKDLKIIISLSGKFVPYRDYGKIGFSNMCMSIICENENELNNLYFLFNSKMYRFLIENNKFSGFNPRKFILNLPNICKYNDTDIYSFFNLTPEEIKLIEDTIKL